MIKYKLYGRVDNKEIIRFYNKNKVDCFVHVSSNEGLPVSIMEAESAGIPVVATDAGGTKELIDGNGVLLPVDTSKECIAEAIINCVTAEPDDICFMRNRSKEIWNRSFNANKNAVVFSNYLKERFNNEIKRIILITEGYPYTDSEKSFLEAEVRELEKSFEVKIIARTSRFRERLSGVISYSKKWDGIKAIFYFFLFLLDRNTKLERSEIALSETRHLIKYWESAKYYGKAVEFGRWFIKNKILSGKKRDETLVYSYWNTEPVLGICFNKQKLQGVRVIARVHGYDYQDERWPRGGRKPFMKTADSLLDGLVFVSCTGKKYHLEKYSLSDSEKYIVSFIGSNGAESDNYINSDGTYRIASCGAMIPLKRIDLIIDSLALVSKRLYNASIEWVHFGDGPLRSQIEEYALFKLGKPNETAAH